MQVLILDDDPEYQARLARALAARDFQIVCVDSLAAAEAVVRLGLPDLLILGERVRGRLSHSVALLADCRDPGIPSVFITDRQGEEIAELFELIPAVYSIMGRATAPAMVAQIAVAAVAALAPRDAWAALPADREGPAPLVVPVTVPEAGQGSGGGAEAMWEDEAEPASLPGVGPGARPVWGSEKAVWSAEAQPAWGPEAKPVWSAEAEPAWSPEAKPVWSPEAKPVWNAEAIPVWGAGLSGGPVAEPRQEPVARLGGVTRPGIAAGPRSVTEAGSVAGPMPMVGPQPVPSLPSAAQTGTAPVLPVPQAIPALQATPVPQIIPVPQATPARQAVPVQQPMSAPQAIPPLQAMPQPASGILADRIAGPGEPQSRALLAAALARLPPPAGRRLHLG